MTHHKILAVRKNMFVLARARAFQVRYYVYDGFSPLLLRCNVTVRGGKHAISLQYYYTTMCIEASI